MRREYGANRSLPFKSRSSFSKSSAGCVIEVTDDFLRSLTRMGATVDILRRITGDTGIESADPPKWALFFSNSRGFFSKCADPFFSEPAYLSIPLCDMVVSIVIHNGFFLLVILIDQRRGSQFWNLFLQYFDFCECPSLSISAIGPHHDFNTLRQSDAYMYQETNHHSFR